MIKDGLPWMVGGSFSGEKAMIGGLSACVGSPLFLVSSHKWVPFFTSTASSGCSLETTLNCGNRGVFASTLISGVGILEEFEVGLGDLDRVTTSLSDIGMLLGDVDSSCSLTKLELGWFDPVTLGCLVMWGILVAE